MVFLMETNLSTCSNLNCLSWRTIRYSWKRSGTFGCLTKWFNYGSILPNTTTPRPTLPLVMLVLDIGLIKPKRQFYYCFFFSENPVLKDFEWGPYRSDMSGPILNLGKFIEFLAENRIYVVIFFPFRISTWIDAWIWGRSEIEVANMD